MLETQKAFWWRTGSANTEGKLGKEPDGEMGSVETYRKGYNFKRKFPNFEALFVVRTPQPTLPYCTFRYSYAKYIRLHAKNCILNKYST